MRAWRCILYNNVTTIMVWKVKVVHRVSAIKMYDTFDRSAVKIHRRAFVSCSRVKACNFFRFVNISSETFLEKLSPLNALDKLRRSMRKTTSCKETSESPGCSSSLIGQKKIFLANQKQAIQTLLELVR